MTSSDDLRAITNGVQQCNPAGAEAMWEHWTKFGFPGASIPEGSRSANKPDPSSDQQDKNFDAERKANRADYREARKIIDRIVRREARTGALNKPEAERIAAERGTLPPAVGCLTCKRLVERTPNDRLLGGECRNCHDYRREHGEPRPKQLWEAELERRAADLAKRGVTPKCASKDCPNLALNPEFPTCLECRKAKAKVDA